MDAHCNMPRQSSRRTASSSLEAVRQHGRALQHAAAELRADRELVPEAAARAIAASGAQAPVFTI
jgi:hypothetical protein